MAFTLFTLSSRLSLPLSCSPGTGGGNISDAVVATPQAAAVLLGVGGGASGLGGGPGGQVDFLSANNTVVRAHAGSTVTMACVVEKESQFGMVSQMGMGGWMDGVPSEWGLGV